MKAIPTLLLICGIVMHGLMMSCGKHSDDELDKQKNDLLECQRKVGSLSSELDKTKGELGAAQTEISKLTETPEAIFRIAVERFDAWSKEGEEETLNEANDNFEKIIKQFPKSKVVAEALKYKSKIQKQLVKIEAVKKETALAAELEDVTINEIVVDPKKYRGKTFIRTLNCDPARYNEFVYTTNIAELNIRAGNAYTARCYFDSVTIGGGFELRLTPDQAKAFAKVFRSGKEIVPGVAVWFSGQLDTVTGAVFYLKRLP